MTWIVQSWSQVSVPLPPFAPGYAVAVVVDESGERAFAHVERRHVERLELGASGALGETSVSGREVTVFTPDGDGSSGAQVPVAIVTGSSRGIGRAIAIELAEAGFRVVVNSHDSHAEGDAVVESIVAAGGEAMYVAADVTAPSQVENMVDRAMAEYGRIDVLVNNAGITSDRRFANMTHEQWDTVISVNLTGTFNCTHAAVRHMARRGAGRVINISSIVGERGSVGQANYAASKGGVIALTKALAREYAPEGIIVNAIAPGYIDTHMLDTIPEGLLRSIVESIPAGRLGTVDDVAKMVKFLCSDDGAYVVGQVIDINGGL